MLGVDFGIAVPVDTVPVTTVSPVSFKAEHVIIVNEGLATSAVFNEADVYYCISH